MKSARDHRRFPITFLALVLAACALPTLLLATACEPTPDALPAARAASAAPAKSAADSVAGAQVTTASSPSWSQLADFLQGYTCSTETPHCAANDEFILAGTSGPATPLYSSVANVKTPQLIASATKMPAAAAILSALYNSPRHYTPGTTVDTILRDYLASANDSKALAFQQAWLQMEQAINSYYQQTAPIGPTPSITVGQLLSMTSGLTTSKLGDPTPDCMNDKSKPDPYTLKLADCAANIASVVKVDNKPTKPEYVVFKPGTMYGYSYAGYQVAGYVATLVAGPTYAGDWISFFRDTFTTPLGLSSYSYNNDLQAFPNGPSPASVSVTNPRISGGASSDAYDYSTILTMILNKGAYTTNNKTQQVVPTTVITWLTTNQLPKQLPPGWIKSPPDDGMNPDFIYDIPLELSPTAAAPFIQGYSFGLFIPTSRGMNDAGFFVSLKSATTPNGNSTLKPADLTTPHDAAMVFVDPGMYGTVGWFSIDPASTFSAVNVIFEKVGDVGDKYFVGLDMMRTADSAISCQFQSPGVREPYPAPIGSSYCVACTPGTVRFCCPHSSCGCGGQEACNANGTWGPCVGATLPGMPCP